ncbi:MAG: MBL fold metallo-hydrolase [Blautia sp.]|jgi:hydroxyacylglutathione hydrolase
MKRLEMQQLILGMVYTNCYFLKNKETGELFIVDPADAPQKIEAMVDRMEGRPTAVLLTHGHYDHILAANALREKYGLKIYACEEERELLENPAANLSGSCSVTADVWLKDQEVFQAAGFQVQMLHTPGHTKGSCCYYLEDEKILLSGDTLFCESVGRTDLPTGSTSAIVRSLHRLLDTLPDEVEVYPGHESMTTIAHEKRYNPFV